jgi:hypothetical protein
MTNVPEQQPDKPERAERAEQAERAGHSAQAGLTERAGHTERADDAVHESAEPTTGGGAPHKPLLGPDATAGPATETPGAGSAKGRLTPTPDRADGGLTGVGTGAPAVPGAAPNTGTSTGVRTGVGSGAGAGGGTGSRTTGIDTGVHAGAGTGKSTGAGTGAAPVTGTGRAAGSADGGDPLIPAGEREKLAHRLHEAVSSFVDGPRHAVEEADRVLEETVTQVTDTLAERRTKLRTAWSGREDADHASATEELRVALRTYREVTERLLDL